MGTSYGADSVTNGLVLSLDAGDKNSYGGSGSTWYDLCGNNDTTINGATYNSDGYFVLECWMSHLLVFVFLPFLLPEM